MDNQFDPFSIWATLQGNKNLSGIFNFADINPAGAASISAFGGLLGGAASVLDQIPMFAGENRWKQSWNETFNNTNAQMQGVLDKNLTKVDKQWSPDFLLAKSQQTAAGNDIQTKVQTMNSGRNQYQGGANQNLKAILPNAAQTMYGYEDLSRQGAAEHSKAIAGILQSSIPTMIDAASKAATSKAQEDIKLNPYTAIGGTISNYINGMANASLLPSQDSPDDNNTNNSANNYTNNNNTNKPQLSKEDLLKLALGVTGMTGATPLGTNKYPVNNANPQLTPDQIKLMQELAAKFITGWR